MSRSILYYPSMDIKDGIWLRNAILYWYHIHSIVPDTCEPVYSPEIKELLDRGIYTPIHPEKFFYAVGNNEFEKEIKYKMERFNSTLRKVDLKFMEQMYFPQMAMMIHYKKLPTELYDLMMSWGVLKVNDEKWVEMEVNAANIYMSTLAEYIAEVCAEDMIVGTDRNSYLYDTFERQWKSSNKMCLTTIFEKALPTPNLDVSYETLLDFRDSREMELLYLRNEVIIFEK